MGLNEALGGGSVYVDANIFIYLIEGFAEFKPKLEILRSLIANRSIIAFTSGLTLTEVLVPPFRYARSTLQIQGRGGRRKGPIVDRALRSVFVKAAELRACLGLRTPDATHVAAALEARCEVFLSQDRRLKIPAPLRLVRLD